MAKKDAKKPEISEEEKIIETSDEQVIETSDEQVIETSDEQTDDNTTKTNPDEDEKALQKDAFQPSLSIESTADEFQYDELTTEEINDKIKELTARKQEKQIKQSLRNICVEIAKEIRERGESFNSAYHRAQNIYRREKNLEHDKSEAIKKLKDLLKS